MRQLTIQVPRGHGQEVMAAARRHDARNLARYAAEGSCGDDGDDGDDQTRPLDVVVANVSNRAAESLLGELQGLPELRVSLIPTGVMVLHPPQGSAPDQVTDVSSRSPLEVYLNGLMSVGSWIGLLGYSLAAALVVWNGLYTNTSFLLIAAMLIAPFAGPAMTLALATARGDAKLLGRSLARYAASVGVTVLTAYVTSLLLGQKVATNLMIQNSLISEVTVFLPLVAGAAGALNLVRAESDSLVSGAATGILVAASLAPPAGLVGMAAAIGEWPMMKSGLFLLGLQLVGINVSGAAVFRIYGLTPKGTRYDRGRGWVAWVAWIASLGLLGGLLAYQFFNTPSLQRATREQRAVAATREAIKGTDLAQVVSVSANFTRSDIGGQNTLYVQVVAQRRAGAAAESETEERRAITRLVQAELIGRDFRVTPLVEVTLLDPPPRAMTRPTSGG